MMSVEAKMFSSWINRIAITFVFAAMINLKTCNGYCAKSNPIVSPVVCRGGIPDNHYKCPRYVTNLTFDESQETTIFKNAKEQWTIKFTNFYSKLKAGGVNISVSMVGDSLTGTMGMQLRCLEELAGIHRDQSIFKKLFSSAFLTHLPQQYVAHDEHLRMHQDSWYEAMKMEGSRKYLVMNSGAWWGESHIDFRSSGASLNISDVMNAFSLQLDSRGHLMSLIRSLQDHYNTTAIWRDIAPAGDCDSNDPYRNHELFSKFNNKARASFRGEGALVLDIWNATLMFHDQHISERDVLHYCLFQGQSAQNIWIEKLMDLILTNEQLVK